MYHRYVCWLVVWNIFYFPFHIWDNPSHWLSYFSGWNHQPDRYVCIANSMSCLFLAPRSAAAAMKAEMFQCVRSPGWPWAPKNRENGGFVGFYGVKDDLTTRITGSLPCSDHNGRPNTIQHVRRWQLGFLQARLQRLTVGTALGLNGVAVTDQRPRAKELGGYVMLAFASLRANRSPSLKGTTKTGSREPPGWPF